MERRQLDELLAQIREVRMQTLSELNSLTQDDFATPTEMPLWTSVRRLLLRFGDHMREHANQIEDARMKLGRGVSMPQRMLAESEVAWGKLLAATAGLTDADLDAQPGAEEWSVRQVLDHILTVEQRYLDGARAALAAAERPRYELADDEIAFYHANGYLGPFTAVAEQEMSLIRAHIDDDVLQRDGPNPRTRVQSRHMDSASRLNLCL